MSDRFPVAAKRRAGACWALLALAGLAISRPPGVTAHDLFTTYVQHRVQLAVGAQHVDLTVDLTFFEEWSARARLAMDADADGRISRAELDAYLKKLAPELAKQVKLRVAGRELPLSPLYAPEADLLGNDRAIPGHHRLRLSFFAPTPSGLHALDEFAIEEHLWPEAKALVSVAAEGRDGSALEAVPPPDPGLAPLRSGEARVFKVRCLTPPQPKPDAPDRSATSSWKSTPTKPSR